MNLARILYPVKVLGPGSRIGLWLCGCSRACKGCSNPELWKKRPEFEISVSEAFSMIHRIADFNKVDGFTFSGGEPMDQAADVAEIIRLVKTISDDILIYSGYCIEELRAGNDTETHFILDEAAVIIDGRYIEELNDGAVLRGSSNQRINIINPKYYNRYQQYIAETHNQIQNFTTSNGIISVGIHHKGWRSI